MQSLELGSLHPVSRCVNSLKEYCILYKTKDPFIHETSELSNPWHHGTSASYKANEKVILSDIQLWVNSFSGLLKDPNGLACFRAFTIHESAVENLEFWEAVEGLSSTSTREQFTIEAVRIYETHIKKSAIGEVKGIYVKTKEMLKQQFLPENLKLLPYNCFNDAQNQVYHLMQNDSYHRFRTSHYFLEYFKQKIKNKPKGEYITPEMLIIKRKSII